MGGVEGLSSIFVKGSRGRLQGVDRGIVDGVYRNGNGIDIGKGTTAGVTRIVGGNGKGIGTVVVGIRDVNHRIQGGIHLSCRTENGDTARPVRVDGATPARNGSDNSMRCADHCYKEIIRSDLGSINNIAYRNQVGIGGIESDTGIFV